MTYKQKIELAAQNHIYIDPSSSSKLLSGKNIVGIYKFFYFDPKERDREYCFYIGKSTDLANRLLGSSNGHIYQYLNHCKKYGVCNNKLVPSQIKEYIENGYEIKVVIHEVDYEDTSFSNAAHRLALAEIQEIVHYQELGQCQLQRPEGAGKREERFWEKNYKKA